MKVIVCGSRRWTDPWPIERMLHGAPGAWHVIHGAAPGADRLAGQVAQNLGHPVTPVPADWDRHGPKVAGHIRNQEMLDMKPGVVFAFKNRWDRSLSAGGTEDMIRRAKAAGVPVYVIEQA